MKVLNVSFPDEDLDLGDLGGELDWTQPEDVSQAGLLLQRAIFGPRDTVQG